MNTELIIQPRVVVQPKEDKVVVRNQQNTGLLSLPEEILLLIMQHTPTKDLHTLSAVCFRLNQLAPDELVERALDEFNTLQPRVNRELSTVRQNVQAVEPRQSTSNFLGRKVTILSRTTDITPLQYVEQDLNKRVVVSAKKANSLKAYVLYLKKHLMLQSKEEKLKQFSLVEQELFRMFDEVQQTAQQVQKFVNTSIVSSIAYSPALQQIAAVGAVIGPISYRGFY